VRVLYVVNNPDFLISHRLEICLEAQNEGYEVHIVCPDKSSVSMLTALNMQVHTLDFGRDRKNPFAEMRTLYRMIQIFKRVKPNLVHLITIKPYLYGGIAARLSGVPAVVSAVAGLGILFSSSAIKYRLLRLALYPLFRFAFNHNNQAVIFQNLDDRAALVNWNVVTVDKVQMIRGSGVSLQLCSYLPESEDVPIISFAARLLKDKASRILQSRNVVARFWLIGEPDNGNANSVTQAQLKQWESGGLVELFGFRKDIPSLFALSNIVTLPSFYGEGLPKVLVEAAACGRAVITTDHPGCRDAIEANETGLLIPIRDVVALADAIESLIKNPEKRKKIGHAGRQLAEREFAIEKIVHAHIQIYQSLTSKV
jgi:glycosyltransferase involved in cell wall biosynthesis